MKIEAIDFDIKSQIKGGGGGGGGPMSIFL